MLSLVDPWEGSLKERGCDFFGCILSESSLLLLFPALPTLPLKIQWATNRQCSHSTSRQSSATGPSLKRHKPLWLTLPSRLEERASQSRTPLITLRWWYSSVRKWLSPHPPVPTTLTTSPPSPCHPCSGVGWGVCEAQQIRNGKWSETTRLSNTLNPNQNLLKPTGHPNGLTTMHTNMDSFGLPFSHTADWAQFTLMRLSF